MFSWLEKHMLPCMYKQLFGIDCPMCGAQRSLVAALKGDLAESFSLYPPLFPVLLLIVLALIWLFNKKIIGRKFMVSYTWSVLALVMISYMVKMILHHHSLTT
jgi:hypothetical protein